jgi:hypothetical protein
MYNNYTSVIKQDGKYWIGWIEENLCVNCQEYSKNELLESLKVTLAEVIKFIKDLGIPSLK